MVKRIALLLLPVLMSVSCEKEDPNLFKINIPNLRFQVDPTIQPPFTYYLPINDVRTNAITTISAHGLDTASIRSIRPTRASVSVVFDDADFDFIDALSVRICPLGVNTENCGREVFYRDPVPFKPGSELTLIPSNIDDISDYLLSEKVNVQVKLERLRGYPQKTFTIRLDMEFGVR